MGKYFQISRFWSDERGATAIEYGLICAMIAVVIISIAGVGSSLQALYDKMKNISGALGGGNNSGG